MSTSGPAPARRRIGIYGWGVVAPGAKDIDALEALLRSGLSAVKTTARPGLDQGLFACGDPDFSFDAYVPWLAERHGEPYVARLRSKMGDNVQFAVGATIQALSTQPGLEAVVREADEACHVYIGSGVGDLCESYKASASLARAERVWNHHWAAPAHNATLRRYQAEGTVPAGAKPPSDPTPLPVDTEERREAVAAWEAYWASRSEELAAFFARFCAIEKLDADEEDSEKAHLAAIRKRTRAHRALLDELGCPPPPWTAVSADLIWNIQNAPAAQITMILGIHGAAWAPVGACSTFGVALECGRSAILHGGAKLALVGTTDPRPDAALAGAFYQARVMPGTGEVNQPFTSLRGTHLSGGSCTWVLGDAEYCEARGLEALGYVDAVALASDAEHIITPSKSGPKRAIARAYEEAGITGADVAVMDLHATGTSGDLNELALVDDYVGPQTRITARKGQLGHGMANAGGWELTALALGLRQGVALPTGLSAEALHPRAHHRAQIVTGEAPLTGDHGVKLMLGIGGITACVVLRRPR
jgi:3-oxoacyl-(acyl-carrier-protein) synthase